MRIAVALLLLSSCAAATPDPEALTHLSWLTGTWQVTEGSATTEEHWRPARGGMMLGVSQTVRDGATSAFEHLRIEARQNGVFYVASPNDATPTEFELVDQSDWRAVFENPEHDFPTRIIYSRDGSRLTARVEGPTGDGGEWVFEAAP